MSVSNPTSESDSNIEVQEQEQEKIIKSQSQQNLSTYYHVARHEYEHNQKVLDVSNIVLDIEVKEEMPSPNESCAYESDDGHRQETSKKIYEMRFQGSFQAEDGTYYLTRKSHHTLMLSDSDSNMINGIFNLVLIREKYPSIPIMQTNTKGEIITPFKIRVSDVTYEPITFTLPNCGEVMHYGATFETKKCRSILIYFSEVSSVLSQNDRHQNLIPKDAKIHELMLLDHDTKIMLCKTRMQVFAFVRKPKPKTKKTSLPLSLPSTQLLPRHSHLMATSTSTLIKNPETYKDINGDELGKETDKEKKALVEDIKRLFDEKGVMLEITDLNLLLNLSKSLIDKSESGKNSG